MEINIENIKNNEDKKIEKIKVVKKKNVTNNNTTVILLVTILLSFVCGAIGAYLIVSNYTLEQVVKTITTSELVENSISTSVDKVYSSTVIVFTYKNGKEKSTGTGFVYKKDSNKAYIMTNQHVVEGADSVEIEFNDRNEKIEAKILGGEVYADVAVLSIDVEKAGAAVEIGNSEEIKLGDTIFTVGAPMGSDYKGSVTKGILSGKDRMVEVSLSGTATDYYMNVLQLDAAVNPGNSGGPLCDVSGKVIGIITLKLVQEEVEGMGFAIPIEDALKYANAIETGGEIVRPYLGVGMLNLTDEYALWQNRILVPEGVTEGVAISEVVKNSPADKAGLEKGDIIVKIGDKKITGLADFRYQLYKYNVGDKVEVTFYRNNAKKTLTLILAKNESKN